MITIIGADGSMGKRYQAILRFIGRKYACFDVGSSREDLLRFTKKADHVIIASPTETHSEYLNLMIDNGVENILCEKPICKDLVQLKADLDKASASKTRISMMMQYWVLAKTSGYGHSYYDYFKTGNDGLIWDCFQIIALAKNEVYVNDRSPIWNCMINGKLLSIKQMDRAYIQFVRWWLEDKLQQSHEYLLFVHEKVANFTEEMNEKNKRACGYTGKVYLD